MSSAENDHILMSCIYIIFTLILKLCILPEPALSLSRCLSRALDSNDLQFSFSSIEYATKLSTFDLSDTGLFKLDGIQDAPALSSLDISGNDFKTFPLEVLKIARLQELFMGSNDFQTSLPTQIADLKELKLMSCASCNLQGELPYSIGKLTNLVHLNLEDNTITGTLPTEMEALENLAFLDLSGQSLHGQLLSFKTLRDLRRLDCKFTVYTCLCLLIYKYQHLFEISSV